MSQENVTGMGEIWQKLETGNDRLVEIGGKWQTEVCGKNKKKKKSGLAPLFPLRGSDFEKACRA